MMRKMLPFLFLSILLSSVAVAQEDWNEARDRAKKHLKNPDSFARLDAVRSLDDHDRKESVDLMLKYWALSTQMIRLHRATIDEKMVAASGSWRAIANRENNVCAALQGLS